MSRPQRYIIQDREQSTLAESFRAIRASIQGAPSGIDAKTIMFTSASQGEGGAMTAANTAASLAYAGNRVVLVDCDMRAPILHEVFGLKGIGMTNVINGDRSLEEAVQNTPLASLKVLPSGPVPRRPLEVLSNEKTKSMIDSLKMMADYVIVNSSPLVMVGDAIVTDTCVLASKVEGVVLVLDSGTVRVQAAKKALALLKGAKANIIGTVLNGVQAGQEFVY